MSELFHASTSRIATFEDFDIAPLPRERWAWGDYVVGRVVTPPSSKLRVELPDGRLARVFAGDRILGAWGTRFATLEATGSWEHIGEDGRFVDMTGAGLFGTLTSISPFLTRPMELAYEGHVFVDGVHQTMAGQLPHALPRPWTVPTILVVGSSMSAGKTESARILVHRLRGMGLGVLAGKLTGAARRRDAQSMGDAGALRVYDFVDAGLPSTVCDEAHFERAMGGLLSRMDLDGVDVAVFEAGASPLEPYNGAALARLLGESVRMTVLAASDPYAVVGLTQAWDQPIDLVVGITANTDAGQALVQRLTGIETLRLIDPDALPVLDARLREKLA